MTVQAQLKTQALGPTRQALQAMQGQAVAVRAGKPFAMQPTDRTAHPALLHRGTGQVIKTGTDPGVVVQVGQFLRAGVVQHLTAGAVGQRGKPARQ